MSAIIDGKIVLGLPREIKEVKNAYEAYEQILKFNGLKIKDLLKAHQLMMNGLLDDAGAFRDSNVRIFNQKELVHLAPPARLVPQQIKELFTWYKNSELHPLVKSSVFHYEFEIIHPFSDGNGRIGRMW